MITTANIQNPQSTVTIIIIERKDLGGIMSKRLQGHLTTLKTVLKRGCDAKWEQSICQMRW